MTKRWTNSQDGVRRVELRVTFRLDERDLAEALACSGVDAEMARTLSVAKIRDAIAAELFRYGMAHDADDYGGVTDEHRAAVRRAYGSPEEG